MGRTVPYVPITYAAPLDNQTLSTLFDKVRGNLADVPEEMLETDIVYDSLKRANQLVAMHASSGTSTTYLKEVIVAIATYYSYQSYTALAARRLGNVPETAAATLANYLSVAHALLHECAVSPIKPNLTTDDAWLSTLKITAICHTKSSVLKMKITDISSETSNY